MQSHTDQSYGIIPIRRGANGYEAFLIHQYSRIDDNTYWTFPKGHPESGETPQQTAERELKEETGLIAKRIIEQPVFQSAYQFSFAGKRIEKTVHFFIGMLDGEQTAVLDPEEVRGGEWFPLAEVRERLDYENTKKLFDKARHYLEAKGEEL